MPGFLVHANAVITCSHPPGKATPTVVNPRVLVMGQPVITQPGPVAVAGCALSTTPTPPCVTGQWMTAATRVFVNAQPVVLSDSQSTCVPTGTPLLILGTQTRVMGI
jgi:hypothetical protein